jgi:hypothetical protein
VLQGSVDFAAASPSPQPISEADRLKFLSILLRQQYFRDATCIEFTNSILTRVGLPVLGSTEGIRSGMRLDVSRQSDEEIRPVIEDGIQMATTPKMLYEISTQLIPTRPNGWMLDLVRTRATMGGSPAVVAKTRFLFELQYKNNKASCELTDLFFGVGPKPQRPLVSVAPVPFKTCLDSFILTPLSPQDSLPSTKKDPTAWLREDCAISLRYSRAAKAILQESVRQK